MREPAETPSEPPPVEAALPPQFQPLLPPQFQPPPLELVRPPFFETPPVDAARHHAEEAAIASLIDEVYTQATPNALNEKTLSRAPGRPESIPFSEDLITFMKDVRRESQPLTAATMASYVRDEHSEWLEGYISGKKDAFTANQSFLRLLRRFAYRHGFVQRTPHGLKEQLEDLESVQAEFARVFKAKYSGYCPSKVFNCDETGIYFDAPPGKILSERGQSAAITAEQKHSARLTAVCTVRGDGVKLPLLFIVRGEPNGTIEREELPTYPEE
ncbi:hypothetical protein PR001_g7028 [Phytophthora rubi]|uniref:DDE-1 domain-containing protein n=1 Tax=Phytophthora rubi TaxID=129364 RepID=A0A6A3NJF7_9STRA|nr:hypothetical protein PR001_g7028 [Phytophthora rubi]